MIAEKIKNEVDCVVQKRRNFLIKKKERIEEEICDIFSIFSFDQIVGIRLRYESDYLSLKCFVIDESGDYYDELKDADGDEEEINIRKEINKRIKKLTEIPISDFDDVNKYLKQHKADKTFKHFIFSFDEESLTIIISKELQNITL